MHRLRRRLAGAAVALCVAAGVTVGSVSAAEAQTTPIGNITTSVACGPLTSVITANVTDGAANATYTESVSVLGITVSSTFTTNASGVGSGVLSLPLSLLGGLVPVQVATGGQSATVNTAINCGL